MSVTQAQKGLSTKKLALSVVGGAITVAIGYRLISKTNLASSHITTEQATSAIALLGGLGGGLSQLLAAQRLSGVSGDTIQANDLILPVGIIIGGNVLATLFVPSQ